MVDDVRLTLNSDATLNIGEENIVDQLPDENGSYKKIAYLIDYTLAKGTKEFKLTIDFVK